jgi:hypothetical protein
MRFSGEGLTTFIRVPIEEGRDVSLRVQWLLFEKLTDEALYLVQVPHTCAPELLHILAVKIYKNQPSQALALLHRVFVFEMPRASTPYKQVLDLVKLIVPLMNTEARQTWLTGLRAEYRAKRNFIKGLDSLKSRLGVSFAYTSKVYSHEKPIHYCQPRQHAYQHCSGR